MSTLAMFSSVGALAGQGILTPHKKYNMAYNPHPASYHDKPYLALVEDVLKNGKIKQNRTGVAARAVFSRQMRFDLSNYTIPMLTSKQMFTRGTIVELLDLFIAGTSNIKNIQNQRVTIWDEWADENGELGPVYGVQWRHWKKYTPAEFQGYESGDTRYVETEIDQLQQLVDKLKNNPLDRRLIVSAWNVADLPEMALPPCHFLFQCYTEELSHSERANEFLLQSKSNALDLLDGPLEETSKVFDDAGIPKYKLSMMLNQRSADVGLGVPFNIVQYSMLLHMLAHVANMLPGEFIWNGGDVHIYENHVEQLQGQLSNPVRPSPTLRFARKVDSIDDFKLEDFIIEGYTPGPKIVMDVAV